MTGSGTRWRIEHGRSAAAVALRASALVRAQVPYCDFNSHAVSGQPPFRRYLDALTRDIGMEAARAGGRTIGSVFLGGGTPSLFDPDAIGEVLDACRSSLRLAADCEITMEVNPGTVEHGRLDGYRTAGVNRLSIGAQSFNARMLRILGRIHGPRDTHRVVLEARRAGFDDINLDVMFALPGQTLEQALADLVSAIALEPSHISWYQLTLEPNTVFYARPPPGIPGDELAWAMQKDGSERLARFGYEQYEVSAFARPGHRCRHNLNYWTFGDYLAAGAGAHGKLSQADGRILRYRKPAHPTSYMEQIERGEAGNEGEQVVGGDLAFEFMLNALRLTEGVHRDLLPERTGLDPESIQTQVDRAIDDGLLIDTGRSWRPTRNGYRFLNDLQARFLP